MEYLKKSKAFYLIVVLTGAIFLWSQIKSSDLVVKLFMITVNTLLIPTIVTLFTYYLLRPLYVRLCKYLQNETLSLFLTLLIFSVIMFFLIREFIPIIIEQVELLINNVPGLVNELDHVLVRSHLFAGEDLQHYLSLANRSFEDLLDILFIGLRNSTSFMLSLLSGSFLVVSIVPIMLIYMLKNTNKPKSFQKIFPERYQAFVLDYFIAIEKTLSDYISGKAVVCFYVFAGSWLTFSIAGLKGALLFAVVAGIMDIVPYFGPWIGALPAALSGLVIDDTNFWVIVIGILIVQLGESYIVSPYVMSKELKMHPLFVIVLMLITGQAFGIIGMIIVLPIVAALKVSIQYLYKFMCLRKELDH